MDPGHVLAASDVCKYSYILQWLLIQHNLNTEQYFYFSGSEGNGWVKIK